MSTHTLKYKSVGEKRKKQSTEETTINIDL